MAEVTKVNPFSKGYKHRHGEPVSDACGDGRHSECDQDLTKCHCTFRGGHTTMHAYASLSKESVEKFVKSATLQLQTEGPILIPDHNLLHTLWTKAVSTPGYNKQEWKELEARFLHGRRGIA